MSSSVSALFNFNASLSDVAPISPIPFPVVFVICLRIIVLVFLHLLLKYSFASAVFFFNDSLNDVIPVLPIFAPLVSRREELMPIIYFLSIVFTL